MTIADADRYGARMVGDRLEILPGQSAFGCVARLVRLNHFKYADIFRLFGLRLRRDDDLVTLRYVRALHHGATPL